ncbi:MAG: DUF2279 domain-containing protein [Flavobacteriales bacterium]|nr:DUF2279 domain-containing protein [Flavobacteriales bacterium]
MTLADYTTAKEETSKKGKHTSVLKTNYLTKNSIPTSLNKKKLIGIVASEVVLYTGAVVGLHQLWYNDFEKSSFHFFNDNQQWKQMDKVGHAFSAYYLGRLGMDLFDWTGMKHEKAFWIGGNVATVILTTIEMYDGFSENWGASPGDIIANLSGTALLISQELLWKQQVVVMKYSFHTSYYNQFRQELLGHSLAEKMFKDYNGQTYWLSGNLSTMISEDTKIGALIPKWLNVAVGYGADGMVGGEVNLINDSLNLYPYRQFYLSLDIDFTRIKTESKALKILLKAVNIIKVPFPAVYFSKPGETFRVKLKPFYF